jgi:hypothetical protein
MVSNNAKPKGVKMMIGTKFFIGSTEYVVDSFENVSDDLKFVKDALLKSGKDAVVYYASKALKSGKRSVQGGMFYRFTKSGNFVKVL